MSSSLKSQVKGVDDEWFNRMATRYSSWVTADEFNIVKWGVLVFRKKAVSTIQTLSRACASTEGGLGDTMQERGPQSSTLIQSLEAGLLCFLLLPAARRSADASSTVLLTCCCCFCHWCCSCFLLGRRGCQQPAIFCCSRPPFLCSLLSGCSGERCRYIFRQRHRSICKVFIHHLRAREVSNSQAVKTLLTFSVHPASTTPPCLPMYLFRVCLLEYAALLAGVKRRRILISAA